MTAVEPPVVPAPPPASTVKPKAAAKTPPAGPKPLIPPRHRGPVAALAAAGSSAAAGVGWLAGGPAGVGVAAGVVGAGAGAVVVAHRRRQEQAVKADPAVKAAEKAAAKLVQRLTGPLGRIPGVRSMPGVRQAVARTAAARGGQTPRPGASGRGPVPPSAGSRPGSGAGSGSGRSSGRSGPGAGRGSPSRAGRPAGSPGSGPGGAGRSAKGSGSGAEGGRRGIASRVTPSGRRAAKAAKAGGGPSGGSSSGGGKTPAGKPSGKAPGGKAPSGSQSAGASPKGGGWRSKVPGASRRNSGGPSAPGGSSPSGKGPGSPGGGKSGAAPKGGGKSPGGGTPPASPTSGGGSRRDRRNARRETAKADRTERARGGDSKTTDRRGDDLTGWVKRPARQRRASEDHADLRGAAKEKQPKAPRKPEATEPAEVVHKDWTYRVRPWMEHGKAADEAAAQAKRDGLLGADGRWVGGPSEAERQQAEQEWREQNPDWQSPAGKPDLKVVGGTSTRPADPGIWGSRSEGERMMRRRDAEIYAADQAAAPSPPAPAPSPAPAAPPARSRRADLNDSQWPEGGRHRAREGVNGVANDRYSIGRNEVSQGEWASSYNRAHRAFGEQRAADANGGRERGASRQAGGQIANMTEDFPRVIAGGQQVIEDAVASMRTRVSAAVAESPSNQAVKDLADRWAEELSALTQRGDEIIALSRQADQVGYDAAEKYGTDPNRGAWMG